MKITVIGPGAIGSIFGTLLADAGHEVNFLAGRSAYPEAVRKNGGLRLEQDGRVRTVACAMETDPACLRGSELIVVLVKTVRTREALLRAQPFIEADAAVLSLQNGLGAADILNNCLPGRHVLAGVTTVGGILLEPGYVRLTGIGKSLLGPWNGEDASRAGDIAAMFCAAGLPAQAMAEPRIAVWEKLMINVGSNALSALTGMYSGEMRDCAPVRETARQAIDEARAVAAALDIPIREDIFDIFVRVGKQNARNRTSMAQDVAARRPTEIDFINGAVSRLGRELAVPTPVNDTLSNLIKGLESRYLIQN
jgi:2-dehydropantoate 2-reductase